MDSSLKLTFCGGVDSVTGANFLLEDLSPGGIKILIDCGLVQGSDFADKENQKPFPYSPAAIDFLLVTHAHIDHIGRIPKLVRDGFRGKIISTPETRAIAEPMLEDAEGIMDQEARRTGVLPIYAKRDIRTTISLWQTALYHQPTKLSKNFEIYLKDAGHVLGSAIYEVRYFNQSKIPAGKPTKVVFTGDLGNSPTPLLQDTEKITDADYLVIESVYGDRNHENRETRRDRLAGVIAQTVRQNGVLLVPCFSLEKTQVLLSELNFLVENKKISPVPVFLDSPLAIKITEIYRRMSENFNDRTRALIASGDNPFSFPKLHFTLTKQESAAILKSPTPKVIIAGSGMSGGGRITEHERFYLSDRRNTILFVGYQAVGSLGRKIEEGVAEVSIDGVSVPVRAKIEVIDGYSSHKDSEHLLAFVGESAETLKKVFVVMGEPKSALFLVQRINDYLGVKAVHPEPGQRVAL
jgi:metallo-beta-lactamase family protein